MPPEIKHLIVRAAQNQDLQYATHDDPPRRQWRESKANREAVSAAAQLEEEGEGNDEEEAEFTDGEEENDGSEDGWETAASASTLADEEDEN